MNKKKSSAVSKISIALGVILIASAVIILLADFRSQKTNEENAKKALIKAEGLIGEAYDAYPEERANSKMPSIMLEGINVIGILEVPMYDLKLAVNSKWNKTVANVMPCKYAGSVYNRDIVIGASDKEGQFSFASTMETGALLSLTDMEGGKYTYTIEKIEHTESIDDEKLQNGKWDLTVFVKASSLTEEYLLLRCNIK